MARTRKSSSKSQAISQWVFFGFIALILLLIWWRVGSQNSPRSNLALLSSRDDYKALGLNPFQVEKWEDGRRTPQSPDFFEWWYFDGIMHDGTIVVVWFGDNWLYGTNTRNVNVEITPPGQTTRKIVKAYADPGFFGTTSAEVRFGPNVFAGDLNVYSVFVDPHETGGLGVNLTLTRQTPPYRPGTGVIKASPKLFAWVVAVPYGNVTGSVTVDGRTRSVSGEGYHDHNWGNVHPEELLDSWWWGRAQVGNETIILTELQGKQTVGGLALPILFITNSTQILYSEYGTQNVRFTQGPLISHPDVLHQRGIPAWASVTTPSGVSVKFETSPQLIASLNFLDLLPIEKRFLATAFGLRPWYSRFFSPVTMQLPGQATQRGNGNLEYYELK